MQIIKEHGATPLRHGRNELRHYNSHGRNELRHYNSEIQLLILIYVVRTRYILDSLKLNVYSDTIQQSSIFDTFLASLYYTALLNREQ